MEKLKNNLDTNNYIFKCSQCEKSLDISDNNFYCKNCSSDFCSSCIKGHNEIFMNHETVKAFEKQSNNSLLANPDLDLDDRQFIDNKIGSNDDMYSDITMLFHETVVSLEENFNEEICKLKAKQSKEKENKEKDLNKGNEKDVNKNIIIIENKTPEFNIDELKKLEPLERIKRIMDIINKK